MARRTNPGLVFPSVLLRACGPADGSTDGRARSSTMLHLAGGRRRQEPRCRAQAVLARLLPPFLPEISAPYDDMTAICP